MRIASFTLYPFKYWRKFLPVALVMAWDTYVWLECTAAASLLMLHSGSHTRPGSCMAASMRSKSSSPALAA